MRRDEDISILLTDKNFQKVLSNWTASTDKEKSDICKKHNLNLEEINILRQIWLGLDFHSPDYHAEKIETALNDTLWEIAKKQNVIRGKSPMRALYERFSRIAALLIVPVILYAFYIQFHHNPAPASDNHAIVVQSQPGVITKLVLPDGTKVCLNAGSAISYPNYFTGKKREVSLTGEAYFEVVKNKEMPMEIAAGNVKLKVYGTTFNVNAYPNESFAKITLVEGSVSLSSSGKADQAKEFFIKPGQTVTYYRESNKLDVEYKDTFQYTAWKDGLLVFKNTSFDSVLRQLSHRFNVDIELANKNLGSTSMDATFKNESLDEILRLLSLSTPFKYSYGPQHKLPDGSFEKSKIYIEEK